MHALIASYLDSACRRCCVELIVHFVAFRFVQVVSYDEEDGELAGKEVSSQLVVCVNRPGLVAAMVLDSWAVKWASNSRPLAPETRDFRGKTHLSNRRC